jgi:hypothetical protein
LAGPHWAREAVVIYLSDKELAELPQRMSGQQFFFLRKLREHPHNLPLKYWPRSTTWRRWARQPGFVRAVQALIQSMESQTQLLMAGAAQQAAMLIQATLTGGTIEHSGTGMCPSEIGLYDKSLKRLMGVMWLQMARADHPQRQAAMREMLESMTPEEAAGDTVDADDAADSTPVEPSAPALPGAG